MIMKKAATAEVKCEACNGTGFPPVIQPARPGRRIYPPPCTVCGGKGRISAQAVKKKNERLRD
jgi:DnaJ-class molecular chaperone